MKLSHWNKWLTFSMHFFLMYWKLCLQESTNFLITCTSLKNILLSMIFKISVLCSTTLRYYFVLFPPYLLTVIISHLYFFPLHSHSEFIRALLFSVITLAGIKSFFFSAALIFSLQGLTDCSFLSFFPLSLPPFSLSSVSTPMEIVTFHPAFWKLLFSAPQLRLACRVFELSSVLLTSWWLTITHIQEPILICKVFCEN